MRIVNISRARGESYVYVGRPSPLGNPFKIGPNSRAAVIRAYKSWLYHKILDRDPAVLNALRALTEESVLGCWCVPEPCHAEAIRDAWRWARKEGII